MTTTAPAKTETVTEWGVRRPAGEFETCYDEREARILAEDYAGVRVVTRTVTRTPWAPPAAEANLCSGTYVLAVPTTDDTSTWAPHSYRQCPGCVGCDHDTVSARAAAMTTEQAFALLPAIDDEEW